MIVQDGSFADTARAVLSARDQVEVFGTGDGADKELRRLRVLLHPDRAAESDRGLATKASARLGELWDQRSNGVALVTKLGQYRRGPALATGDLSTVYGLSDDSGRSLALKVARRPTDNDLLKAEAVTLVKLATKGIPIHRPYVPELVESFAWRDPSTGMDRVANIMPRLEGFVTLETVARAFPGGLDPKDAAWMWRRLLVAIGFAHRAGIVHGAVFPEHVMIHPEMHGLVLVDWCWSTSVGGRAVAIIDRHRSRYPDEVLARQPLTAATDIHLAAGCMAGLMGSLTPPPMAALIRACQLKSSSARPDDAWESLRDLDDILDRLWGPRVFRPFHHVLEEAQNG